MTCRCQTAFVWEDSDRHSDDCPTLLPDAYYVRHRAAGEITETANLATAEYLVSLYGGRSFRTFADAVDYIRS
jgi:hypothetical protein